MKKIFVLIFALIMALSLCISVGAEELMPGEVIDEEITESVEQVIPEEPEENYGDVAEGEPSANAGVVYFDTVLTRAFEWWEQNKTEILTVAGFLVTAAFTAFGKAMAEKISKLMDGTAKIGGTASDTQKNTAALVSSYNKMVDVVSDLTKQVSELSGKIDEVGRKTLETEEIEESIAKILNTAYTHSALDNGTKEIINIEYAGILKKVHGEPMAEVVTDEEQN
jgi:hypothetical protein